MAILEVINVSKSFKKKRIIDKANFSVEGGEIIGLVGSSGAGKSVLIKMLIGFLTPDSGTIKINSLTKNPIGFSMQNNSLYDSLTVMQNLNYFSDIYGLSKKEKKVMIPTLIERLNLKDYENILIRNLSGGTKKRVDIACGLLNNPEIIILDEPLLGLDPVLVKNFINFIYALQKNGRTIIISSHIMSDLSNICSRIFMLKNGKISEINKCDIAEAYC